MGWQLQARGRKGLAGDGSIDRINGVTQTGLLNDGTAAQLLFVHCAAPTVVRSPAAGHSVLPDWLTPSASSVR
jgi:hypothetical protein